MRKLMSVLVMLLVLSLMSVSLVSASFAPGDVTIEEVEIDGANVEFFDEVQLVGTDVDKENGYVVLEREELKVDVLVRSTVDVEDLQVEAEIRGHEYDDWTEIHDRTQTFKLLGEGSSATRWARLTLQMPDTLEEDRYLLRIEVSDKDSARVYANVVLQVEPQRHGLEIADVAFSPGNTVQAGRSLLASVELRNYGDREEEAKVRVEIPALGVQATEFDVEVDSERDRVNREDVPEVHLAIPANAAPGDYDVVVSAWYDNGYEMDSKTYTVHVAENPLFFAGNTGKLVLAVGPESQTVFAGSTVSYGVALTNAGRESRAYVLQVVGSDAAAAVLSESLVVLEPGRNKVVRVDVTAAANAPVGEHVVSLVINSGNEQLETVPLRAMVVPGAAPATSGVSLRNGLEIALIVLVVLLVIVGLIIGFSRLRRDEDDEEQTYY